MIPDHIKKAIKANASWDDNEQESIRNMEYGYSLAQQEIEMRNEYYENKIDVLNRISDGKDKEITTLQQWKKEALEVMPDMPAIGKALNIPLGETVHDKILPEIERLKERIYLLEIELKNEKESGRHPF